MNIWRRDEIGGAGAKRGTRDTGPSSAEDLQSNIIVKSHLSSLRCLAYYTSRVAAVYREQSSRESSSCRMASIARTSRRALTIRPSPRQHHVLAIPHLQIPPAFQPRQVPSQLLPAIGTAITNLSSFISTLWESVLKAAPKKKQSYARKRDRQLANKGLKDITNVMPCPSCGRPKRAHALCEHCVARESDFAREEKRQLTRSAVVKAMWAGKYDEFKEKIEERIEGSIAAPKNGGSSAAAK